MNPETLNLVLAVGLLVATAILTALVDRWANRRRLLPELFKSRQSDCPWPVDDERQAHLLKFPQHDARYGE